MFGDAIWLPEVWRRDTIPTVAMTPMRRLLIARVCPSDRDRWTSGRCAPRAVRRVTPPRGRVHDRSAVGSAHRRPSGRRDAGAAPVQPRGDTDSGDGGY